MDTAPYRMHIATWPKGHARATSCEALPDPANGGFTWVHVQSRDPAATRELLQTTLGFHDLEIEDALTEGERPHLHEAEDHFFFTAPAIRTEEMRIYFAEVAFFVGKSRVVTVSNEPVPVLDSWCERVCQRDTRSLKEGIRLAYILLDAIVDDYYPAMDMLEDHAEELEQAVFEGRIVPIKELLRLKRRLLEIRRRLTPLRDILNGLLRHDVSLISRSDRPYYQDVYDHVLRILEHAELNRDILASVLDANLTTTSNRLNQIMRIMTVLATILMSVALIAGIYGMNFRFMPELGSPWGYPASLVAMALVAALELWIFRKKGWI